MKAPFHIPLGVGLVGAKGENLPLNLEGKGLSNHHVIELTERTQSFRFTGLKERPVLSINRAFAAPIKLALEPHDEDLLFLMAHDSDSFNRWEAGQTIARKLIMEAMPALAQGSALPDAARYAAALGASLENQALEPAFVALMLSPPGEGDIAGELGRDVDTDLVHGRANGCAAKAGGCSIGGSPRHGSGPCPIRSTAPIRSMPGSGRCATAFSACWRRPIPRRGRNSRSSISRKPAT